jgi:GT2 family glycosyltransferase
VLLDCIGQAPELTLVRGLGNQGDELIWDGTRQLLSGHVYREIGIRDLAVAGGDTALLTGGGAWSRAYHEHMPTVLAIAESRFRRVIVLPSTFDLGVDRVRDALARTRAIVFAREPESYRRISGLCDARLAHDCAFYFDYDSYRQPGSGTLHAFRTDLEASGAFEHPIDNDDISATAASLEDWLSVISRHERVETDRAHVMIAAALMGKEVGYAPGAYFKVSALAQTLPPDARATPLVSPGEPGAGRALIPPRPKAPIRARMESAAANLEPAAPIPGRDGRPRVCGVILSHNRPHLVPWSARSVLRSGEGVRVLVLDNNSDLRTRSVLSALDAGEPRVEIQYSDRNLGCGGGRHLAVLDVDEDLVLFLDDDAELLPGALERLVAELDAHPAAQAVCANVVIPDGTISHCGGSFVVDADVARFTLDGSGLVFDDPEVPPTGRCDWAPGTATVVRRSALERCPIDPSMSAYYEDNDWAMRMTVAYPEPFRRCREALAIHHMGSRPAISDGLAMRDFIAQRLGTLAHFLTTHDRLLDSGGREVLDVMEGTGNIATQPATARLLLRMVSAVGPQQLVVDWTAGDLGAVLASLREEAEDRAHERTRLHQLATELEADRQAAEARLSEVARERDEARAALASLDERVQTLQERHEMLVRVEAGGWWRLRGRIHGVLGAAGAIPAATRQSRRRR